MSTLCFPTSSEECLQKWWISFRDCSFVGNGWPDEEIVDVCANFTRFTSNTFDRCHLNDTANGHRLGDDIVRERREHPETDEQLDNENIHGRMDTFLVDAHETMFDLLLIPHWFPWKESTMWTNSTDWCCVEKKLDDWKARHHSSVDATKTNLFCSPQNPSEWDHLISFHPFASPSKSFGSKRRISSLTNDQWRRRKVTIEHLETLWHRSTVALAKEFSADALHWERFSDEIRWSIPLRSANRRDVHDQIREEISLVLSSRIERAREMFAISSWRRWSVCPSDWSSDECSTLTNEIIQWTKSVRVRDSSSVFPSNPMKMVCRVLRQFPLSTNGRNSIFHQNDQLSIIGNILFRWRGTSCDIHLDSFVKSHLQRMWIRGRGLVQFFIESSWGRWFEKFDPVEVKSIFSRQSSRINTFVEHLLGKDIDLYRHEPRFSTCQTMFHWNSRQNSSMWSRQRETNPRENLLRTIPFQCLHWKTSSLSLIISFSERILFDIVDKCSSIEGSTSNFVDSSISFCNETNSLDTTNRSDSLLIFNLFDRNEKIFSIGVDFDCPRNRNKIGCLICSISTGKPSPVIKMRRSKRKSRRRVENLRQASRNGMCLWLIRWFGSSRRYRGRFIVGYHRRWFVERRSKNADINTTQRDSKIPKSRPKASVEKVSLIVLLPFLL